MLALRPDFRQTGQMMRFRFALCLPMLLTACVTDAEDRRRENEDRRIISLIATETLTKPAIPQPDEPAPPPQLTVTPTCATLVEEISRTAPLCVLEQADTDRQKIDCTPKTCPECAKMVAAREAATAAGCI